MNIILEVLLLLLKIIAAYIEAFYRLFVPVSPKSVRNQLVLITGGSRGIGRCIALEFAKRGANIALWDINQSVNEQTAQEIENSTGVRVKAYKCDVTSIEDVKNAAANLRRDMGKVDILVNNAGVMKTRYLLDLSEAEIKQTMDVNIMAHFWTIREFLPDMLEQKKGHIVNIASIAGMIATPMLTDYNASKFAVIGFSSALAEELRQDFASSNVDISIVCPTFVGTNLISDISDRIRAVNRFDDPLTPEFVAESVVDGVTRNHLFIFVPKSLVIARGVIGVLPRKALIALAGFVQARFYPIDKK